MSWVAIPETLPDDPRIIRLGDAALAALVRLYAYASRHETDGFLPPRIFEANADEKARADLLSAGFVETIEGGFGVVGFLDHNLTHEQRVKNRTEAKKRQQLWRDRQSRNAVTNAVTNTVTNATDRDRDRDRYGNGDGNPISSPPAGRSASPRVKPACVAELAHPSHIADEAGSASAVPAVHGAPVSLKSIKATGGELVVAVLSYLAAKPARDDVDRVWRHHTLRHAVETGAKPTWYQHYAIQIHALLEQHPVEEVIRRLDNYYDRPVFGLHNGSRDFGAFLKGFGKLALTGDGRVARQIEFERAGQAWLATANGTAERLPPEVLNLMRGRVVEVAF